VQIINWKIIRHYFVVDGVSVDNPNTAMPNRRGGCDYGNAGSRYKPNDIESINVFRQLRVLYMGQELQMELL
jgi:hypothetical protein